MTSIANLLTSSNYQNSSQKTEANEEVKKTTSVTSKDSASTGLGGAYNLDLSPEAQAYLKSLEAKKELPKPQDADYGFSLTEADRIKLAEIVEKYKDMDYTQENFDKLQAELKANRLDSLNLAAKDMLRSFNATTTLMDALNGTATILSANDRMKTQAGNSDKYIEQVAADWYNQIMLTEA